MLYFVRVVIECQWKLLQTLVLSYRKLILNKIGALLKRTSTWGYFIEIAHHWVKIGFCFFESSYETV